MIATVENLNAEATFLGDIVIQEDMINGKVSPDIASIHAPNGTPHQVFNGKGTLSDVLIHSPNQIKITLISPDGERLNYSYDPRICGGLQGYTISEGWEMQIEGEVVFFEYMEPIGFSEPYPEGGLYGEKVIKEITD